MTNTFLFLGDENMLNEIMHEHKYSKIFLLADAKTNGFCIPVLKNIFKTLNSAYLIIIPDGEQNKTLDTCELIWNDLLKYGADKKSLLINVGGGTLSDIGGLAASLYKRGIDTINIPTTLLSMVDASVGGKTAVDFMRIKNILGSMHFPIAIYINPIFLKTVSDRNILSGSAEMIKHALISNNNLWNQMQSFSIDEFSELKNIKEAIVIKNSFVEKDPNDNHIRQALNFGHSIGHAIESYFMESSQALLHGEAIILGMEIELALSILKHNLSYQTFKEYTALKNRLFPQLNRAYTLENLKPYLLQDKKNNGSLNMSLISSVGKPELKTEISLDEIQEALHMI